MITNLEFPNYSGMLYTNSNKRTPLLNAIRNNVKYTNSTEFVVGQFYENEEGDIPAISENASLTAPAATGVERTQQTNVTQIFHEKIGISYLKSSNGGMLSGANIAGQVANPTNELDFQVARKMEKIGRDIENTFVNGEYNKATSKNEINSTRGIVEAITTNEVTASNAPLDLWLVNDALQAIYDNSGDLSDLYLVINTVQLNQITAAAIESGIKVGDRYTNEYGVRVIDLVLPLATVHLYLGEYLPSGTALLLNFGVMGPVEQPVPGKGNFFLEELAKIGAGEEYQIYGQIGLDHGPEWMHAKITGLATTFVKPTGIKRVEVVE